MATKPLPLPTRPRFDTIIPTADTLVQDKIHMLQTIKEHLAKAQNKIKILAGKHRIQRQFSVRD